MTPLESQMGAAVAAGLSVNPDDARQYANDAAMVAKGLTGPNAKIMQMAADTADAFATFCAALGVITDNFHKEG